MINRDYPKLTRRIDLSEYLKHPNDLVADADYKFSVARELYKLADRIYEEGRQLQAEAVDGMVQIYDMVCQMTEEEENK